MKFIVKKASTEYFEEEVTISTLEELKSLQDRFGHVALVIDFYDSRTKAGSDTYEQEEVQTITVYDDYME